MSVAAGIGLFVANGDVRPLGVVARTSATPTDWGDSVLKERGKDVDFFGFSTENVRSRDVVEA
jgi:hypothetical protein